MRYIYRKFGKWEVSKKKMVNGKTRVIYYGRYDTLSEAKSVRDKAEREGWIKQPKSEDPLINIRVKTGTCNYSVCKSINNRYKYYGTFSKLELAQFVRDKYEEYGWSKENLPKILSEFPMYYTNSLYFYRWIRYDGKSDYPWKLTVNSVIDGKQRFEVINSYSRVEDALWERDLYIEYGDDLNSWCEDTRPNPYDNMKLPYYMTYKTKVKLSKDLTKELKYYKDLILAHDVRNAEELSRLANRTAVGVRGHFRKYGVNFDKFKDIVMSGVDPLSVLSMEYNLILPPDKVYHQCFLSLDGWSGWESYL